MIMDLKDFTIYLMMLIPWLAGIALAESGKFTVFALICPVYSWYLVVEKEMMMMGVVQ